MSDKSATPRTDKVYALSRFSTDDDLRIELGDLARQLERELAEKEAENAALREDAERYRGCVELELFSFSSDRLTDSEVDARIDHIIKNYRDAAIDSARRGE